MRWAKHDVRYHDTGIQRIQRPVVGRLELAYEVLKSTADSELTIFAYRPEPGSKSEETLNLLASWTATLDEPISADVSDRSWSDMQLTRNGIPTGRGRSEWFTGGVYIDTIAAPSDGSRLSVQRPLHPKRPHPWHTHPNGQPIWVTEGIGLCQRRGGPMEVIRPGDRVFFEAGEDHWHGAARDRFMTHVAMLEGDDHGNPATLGDHVTDDEYAAAPAIDD